jgi:hypothetical protein
MDGGIIFNLILLLVLETFYCLHHLLCTGFTEPQRKNNLQCQHLIIYRYLLANFLVQDLEKRELVKLLDPFALNTLTLKQGSIHRLKEYPFGTPIKSHHSQSLYLAGHCRFNYWFCLLAL